MSKNIRTHRDLEVYKRAFDAAMRVFHLTKQFPDDERYALTSQIRRSSRSVCNNLAEAWRKRRYEAAFVAKISDAETEAGETQSHLEFCVACSYMTAADARELYRDYNAILRTLVGMVQHSDTWIIRRKS